MAMDHSGMPVPITSHGCVQHTVLSRHVPTLLVKLHTVGIGP